MSILKPPLTGRIRISHPRRYVCYPYVRNQESSQIGGYQDYLANHGRSNKVV